VRFTIVFSLENRHHAASDRIAGESPPTGVTVIEWIRKNYAKPLHIAALARLASMSPHRFTAIQSCDRDEPAPIPKASSSAESSANHAFGKQRCGFFRLRSGLRFTITIQPRVSTDVRCAAHQHMHRMRLLERHRLRCGINLSESRQISFHHSCIA